MNNSVSSAIQELNKSPIFALSLGGKELSHSNFWKWLIDLEIGDEHPHPFIEVFMPGFYKNGFVFTNVKREEGNRDISIHFDDNEGNPKCFVIENKLKSIPTEKQLKKYTGDLEEKFGGGLLTGLRETLKLSSDGEWDFRDYDHIADDIERINERYKDENEKNYYYIRDYVENIRNISEVINGRIEEQKDIYVWEDNELDEIKLADIFLKHQAEVFKNEIEASIKKDKKNYKTKWGDPFVYTSFNNKKPTITVIYQEKDDKKKKDDDFEAGEIGRIGIQIEGKEFRLYAGPSKEGNIAFEFDKLRDLDWFEEFDYKKSKKIDNKKTSMEGGREDKRFCQYKKNNYKHMYQYWNIDKGTPYENLIKEILKKLKDAKKIIDASELSFK